MNLQELYGRYPKIDSMISLGNQNREHSPEIAQICDFIAGMCADLIDSLPAPPPVQVARFDPFTGQPLVPPAPEPAPVARFDPFTGQPLAPPAPAQWTPPVGTPGLSQGWPQPQIPS